MLQTNLSGRLLPTVLTAVLLLTGCAARQPGGQTPAASPASQPTATPAAPVPASPLHYFNSATGSQTADGFYSMEYHEDWTGYIVYHDFATLQSVPLCSRPDCEHHDASCTAWIENPTDIPDVMNNGRQLLYCYNNFPGPDKKPSRIETANLDGSDRRELYTFAANDVLDTGVGIDENAVYLLARHVEETSETWRMLRIDTQDGSETVLWQTRAKSDTSYYFSGCLDNQLVLKEIRPGDGVFDDPLEQLRHQVHTLYLLSPAGGDLQPLYSWQQDTGLELPARDELFYVSDGQLSQLTGSGGLTPVAQSPLLGQQYTFQLYVTDDALWVSTTNVGPEAASSVEVCRIAPATGQVETVPLSASYAVTIHGNSGDKLFIEFMPGYSISDAGDNFYALVPEELLCTAATVEELSDCRFRN